jgi:hypothetical protein
MDELPLVWLQNSLESCCRQSNAENIEGKKIFRLSSRSKLNRVRLKLWLVDSVNLGSTQKVTKSKITLETAKIHDPQPTYQTFLAASSDCANAADDHRSVDGC